MEYFELSNREELEDLHKKSFELSGGLLIFKHSRRCSISAMAFNRFTRNWKYDENKFPIYYLDVIGQRNISNEVANKYAVRHESPQILLIKNGNCEFTASHMGIDPKELNELLNE
tara:strand:- start:875 stop:1219 length:345 start_codon:yes stop_codon:yes gene_type:complete